MYTNPTLVSMLLVNQRDGILGATERLDRSEIDLGGSQTFGLLDLVPVEDFKLEVPRDTRRLNSSRQRAGAV